MGVIDTLSTLSIYNGFLSSGLVARAWHSIGGDGVWGETPPQNSPPKQATPTTYESLAQVSGLVIVKLESLTLVEEHNSTNNILYH